MTEIISAIIEAGFIPVVIEVYDTRSNEKIREHLVACYAVPRSGEVVEYDDQPLEVFAGFHKFESNHVIRNTKIPTQVVTVAAREI